jgi:hypothetical protein
MRNCDPASCLLRIHRQECQDGDVSSSRTVLVPADRAWREATWTERAQPSHGPGVLCGAGVVPWYWGYVVRGESAGEVVPASLRYRGKQSPAYACAGCLRGRKLWDWNLEGERVLEGYELRDGAVKLWPGKF